MTAALEVGYRHIDTAAAYGNERGVGEALAAPASSARGLPRDQDLDHRLRVRRDAARVREERRQAGRRAARPADPAPGAARRVRPHPRGVPGAREAARGRTGPRHRRQQLHARPPHPAARRDERRAGGQPDRGAPLLPPAGVLAVDAEHGILTQAWSPIGGITFYRDGSHGSTLEDAGIGEIAKDHGKTPAQVMLRWHLQQGRQAIPKSVTPRGSRRTSTSSTSSSPTTSSPPSTRSTPACAAGPSPSRSPSRPSAAPSRRPETEETGERTWTSAHSEEPWKFRPSASAAWA